MDKAVVKGKQEMQRAYIFLKKNDFKREMKKGETSKIYKKY